jgi:hypothetical protein
MVKPAEDRSRKHLAKPLDWPLTWRSGYEALSGLWAALPESVTSSANIEVDAAPT